LSRLPAPHRLAPRLSSHLCDRPYRICLSTVANYDAKMISRWALMVVLGLALLAHAAPGHAQDRNAPRFKAVAFDYFVIFNPDSIIPEVEKVFPGKGAELTKAWRAKLFDYCFLCSITGEHEDFYKLTSAMKLTLTPESHAALMQAWLALKPWPDTAAGLRRLKAAGVRIITIANFSEKMLRANADHAGITDLFDKLLSTEVNGTFKPDPRAYALGMQTLNLKKEEILFAAFGGWDAYGAKHFGYPTYWVNRFSLPPEGIGAKPDQTSTNLEVVLQFVLPASQPASAGQK
jgi:2-haloacid dehalogenase